MPDQTMALAPTGTFAFEPQDRKAKPAPSGVLGTMLSLVVAGAAIYQVRDLDFSMILALVPTSPTFWGLFAVSYLIGPAGDWFIFQRLWGIGASAFGALVRKLIYNELLVGYLGEIYFYGWARQNLKFVTTPFGAVKDVAVLSAIAGNVTTLVFLAVAFPLARMLSLHDHATAISLSLAFVIGTSLAVLLLRRSLFSLERKELRMVFAVHLLRILATAILSAALWHLVLPDVELGWWLILVTIRLLISRLPFVPNKDVVFAGIAVFALGGAVEMSALMALMAGLTLAAHMLVGLGFALGDLFSKGRSHEAPAR
ncbi:hypothetical protein J2W40_003548 [Sphingobium xenophagum]|uniref:Flippase-like domain-containing protein n=1 Tax=Sphingobium xenophagum TaxID=121428 RepID=A0ABU1X561_SPHXE|nr:hypothetical protein [Sphingobium xenophagum]MDR7156703.1 hypothetical protein [Sphingobium xenophagum]